MVNNLLKKQLVSLKFRIRTASKQHLMRNMLTMITGAVAAQIISFLFIPLVTRLYGPEVFGALGVFTSMIGIVLPIAALTFPVAIVLPKYDNDALSLVKLSLGISLIAAILMAVFLSIFSDAILNVFQIEVLENYIFFIPLAMFLGVSLQVTMQWFIRKKRFATIAKTTVFQTIIINLNKVGFGFAYPYTATLIWITILGYGLQSFLFLLSFKDKLVFKKIVISLKQTSNLKSIAKEYKDFAIYRTPEVFINAVSQSLPVLMLTVLYSPIAAGFYTIARTVLELPTQLIGRSVGDVFYPRISEIANKGENISRILLKTTGSLALVGIIPFSFIIIYGPDIFGIVFGVDWTDAGEYGRSLALLSLFTFINIPSVKTLTVISAQRLLLFFSLISTVLRLGALSIGAFIFNNDVISLALFSITGAILNLILILLTFRLAVNFERKR